VPNKKVLLMGGVGNQLFQILRAQSHSSQGCAVELLRLSKNKNFIYKLVGFSNHSEWLNIDNLAFRLDLKIREITFHELLLVAINYFLKKVGLRCWFNSPLKEKSNNLTTFLSNGIDVGYFQNSHHFTSIAMNQLILALIDELEIISTPMHTNIFTIHVRGGDFPINDRINKYQVNKIIQQSEDLNLDIKVITNDSAYAQVLFSKLNYNFLYSGSSALDDFRFMCLSKNLYLSNSSFSFWAAKCSQQLGGDNFYVSHKWDFSEIFKLRDL